MYCRLKKCDGFRIVWDSVVGSNGEDMASLDVRLV